ncbi:universal stress protein [Nocardia ignorata]|uniref:Nucleotide-binding universal stress UspA family protein n=1 Tax=Nocardia ignorata TaxID=145285 RepID=A0A4R6P2U3_NOCIG|nr:universal stress protein [Nocardia ignorata]TDP31857.1 nucleotide-binding universal stress UspA family protein [Nocardia ignorata]
MSSDDIRPAQHRTAPVLAAVDGSAISYQAAAWGAAEAVLHHRPLHILTSAALPVGSGPALSLGEADLEWLRVDAERIVGEAARVARAAVPDEDLVVTTEVSFESAAPLLIERSASARILVVGSRGLGAFQRGLLGSISTAVTRHARCPVAVIHGNVATDPVSAALPVLVGVDGSANSVPAVELAFEEASRRKVDLVALHAFSDYSADLPTIGWEMGRQTAEAELGEALAGHAEQYPDVDVRRIVVANRPVRSLLDASSSAQLLVVGSHGRGGFASMVLGSTSNALLHSVEIPMIVVRDRG